MGWAASPLVRECPDGVGWFNPQERLERPARAALRGIGPGVSLGEGVVSGPAVVVGDARVLRDRTPVIASLARFWSSRPPEERWPFGWRVVMQCAAARIGRRVATLNNTIVSAARLA